LNRDLVHQPRGAKGVVGALPAERVVGDGAELLVDGGEQAVHRIAIAGAQLSRRSVMPSD
jgi:hypothetical protein